MGARHRRPAGRNYRRQGPRRSSAVGSHVARTLSECRLRCCAARSTQACVRRRSRRSRPAPRSGRSPRVRRRLPPLSHLCPGVAGEGARGSRPDAARLHPVPGRLRHRHRHEPAGRGPPPARRLSRAARSQNPMACWNWFRPGDQHRGAGEPAFLAELARCARRRSSGAGGPGLRRGPLGGRRHGRGAGRNATPSVFAAAGVHSGLPYRGAERRPLGLCRDARRAGRGAGGDAGGGPSRA